MAGNRLEGHVTRFAPSPTGLLHLGHAYSALTAQALAAPGEFLLRIEDIDRERCKLDFEQAIYDDLRWLGLDWPLPVMRQSGRMTAYQEALTRLAPLTYPCRCRRSDIRAVLSAPQEGALPAGPDGLIYPGTCRQRSMSDAGPGDVIRLDAARAFDALGINRISFREAQNGGENIHSLTRAQFINEIGDVVLSRRGMGTSYHLAVVVDDAEQRITLVSRGNDLLDSTYIHRLLQKLLKLSEPQYHHHALIRDNAGKRLAKRDDARSIRAYRDEGATPPEVRSLIGF